MLQFKPVPISLLLAACGGPSSSMLGNQTASPPPEDPLALVLAPRPGSLSAVARFVTESTPTGEAMDDPPPHNTTYDFDGDGVTDLTSVGQIMYGPTQGWVVSTRAGGELAEAFAVSGAWGAAAEYGPVIAMRFDANILAAGEAQFSLLVRYDRGKRAFEPLVRAYVAQETKVPAVRAPFARFTTTGPATLRATPEIDDRPRAPDAQDEYTSTAKLAGNVVARYAANARGLVLASEGSWRYVAFDFATRPLETSLAHGMDASDASSGERKLTADAWLCGWVKAGEIR